MIDLERGRQPRQVQLHRVRVPIAACAQSRPVGSQRPAINRQSVTASTCDWRALGVPKPNRCVRSKGVWLRGGSRRPTRKPSKPAGLIGTTARENRASTSGEREQNAVRATCRDPQPGHCSHAGEVDGGSPSTTPLPVRMGMAVVGSADPTVETGVRSGSVVRQSDGGSIPPRSFRQ